VRGRGRERRTETLRTFITPTTRRRIDAYRDETGVTASTLINRLLVEFLNSRGTADPDPQAFVPADARGRK